MEIIKDKFIKSKEYSLVFLTDIHEGHANQNRKAFLQSVRDIEEIGKQRPTKVILGGDHIDCIILSDPRFSASSVDEKYHIRDLKDLPIKQTRQVAADLKPIHDLIIAACIGNHEEQYIKRHFADVYDIFCEEVGARKLGYKGFIDMQFQRNGSKINKVIAVSHGGGGGGYREGYALRNHFDYIKDMDADIYFTGHIHPAEHSATIEETTGISVHKKDPALIKKRKYHAVGYSYLEKYMLGTRNYAESSKRKQSLIGFIELRLKWRKENNRRDLIGQWIDHIY